MSLDSTRRTEDGPPASFGPARAASASSGSTVVSQNFARRGKLTTLSRVVRRIDAWIALVALLLIGWGTAPDLMSAFNLRGLLNQSSVIGLLALGQFLVILCGGFDLSVAGVVGFGGVVAATFIGDLGFVGGLLSVPVCACLGVVNGIVVTRFRVSPFIATLGMDGIGAALALGVSASPIAVSNPTTIAAGSWHVGFVPFVAFVWVGVALAIWAVLDLTPVGTHIAAVGGREATARLAGINTTRVRIGAYAFSAALAGLAGFLFVIVSSSGDPTLGSGWELLTIAMVVIGGSELFGGKGFLPNALAGVLVYEVIINILNLAGVDPNLQSMFSAVVIVVIVAARVIQQR